MNAPDGVANGAAHYPGKVRPAPARGGAFLFLVVLVGALAGCGGGETVRRDAPSSGIAMPRTWPVVPPEDPARANAVLMRALGLVGTPYRYGGNSPEGGFDCSGLVGYVFRTTLGIELPRVSRDMASKADAELVGAREELRQGDLVFFGLKGRINHVGI